MLSGQWNFLCSLAIAVTEYGLGKDTGSFVQFGAAGTGGGELSTTQRRRHFKQPSHTLRCI